MKSPYFGDVIFQLYLKELADRDAIFNRANLVISMQMAILAIVAYISKTFEIPENNYLIQYALLTYLILFVILMVFSCINIIKAITGHRYHEVPKLRRTIQEFIRYENYNTQAREYNKYAAANNIQLSDIIDSSEETNKTTLKNIAKACDLNSYTNKNRRDYSKKSIEYVFACLPLLVAGSFIFVYHDLDASSPRKDNGIHDQRMNDTLKEINDTLKEGSANLRQIGNTMATQNNSQTPSPKPNPGSTPPKPPQKPPVSDSLKKLRVSNESYNNPIPTKKILNENK